MNMKQWIITAATCAAFASYASAQGVGTVMADTNGVVRTPSKLEARIAQIETDAKSMATTQDVAQVVKQIQQPPVASVNGATGAVTITAAQIGAITSERDPVAGPRLAIIEGQADNWDAAYGWGNHALAGYLVTAAWQSWLGTNTYVKTETDSLALAALATQRVERVWAQDGTGYRDGTGGVWRIYDSGSTTGWVAVIPDIPEEIAIPGLAFPVASVWEGSDVSWSMTVEATGYPDVYDITFNYIGFGTWDAGNVTSTVLPIVFQTFTGSGPTQPMRLEWRGAVTTQMVDTVALVSQLPGIVYSNSVSQMVVWTNATGAVTNMAVCEGGTWYTNAFGAGEPLPDGIVTNNYAGMVGLRDGLTVSGNSVFSNDLRVVGGTFLGQTFFTADGAILCYGEAHIYAPSGFAWQYWTGSSVANAFYYDWNGVTANAYVPGGSMTVRDTVAASSFTATGTVSAGSIILPHLGTNTTVSLIFTNGTLQAWEIAP